jgi:hypothetical protein
MDYRRIYREFIRDRMGRPEPEGYVEIHHILPRCLGGDDGPHNLIKLRPEEHFWVHLVLARMHPDVPGLVVTPAFMLGLDKRLCLNAKLGLPAGFSRASRGSYAMARRMHVRAISGENNRNFDPTIHHFRHPVHGDRHLTGHAFRQETGIQNVGQFSKLLTCQIKSINGWHMPAVNPEGITGYEASSRSLIATKRDKTIYEWRHQDGRIFRGAKNQFMEYSGVTRQVANIIATGFTYSCHGWYNPQHNPEGLIGAEHNSGERHPRADLTIHRFSHDNGCFFVGTRWEMEEAHGPFGRSLDCVVNGSKLSAKGWMLEALRAEQSERRFLGEGVSHIFRHPERGEFVGTQIEFTRMAKCSPGNVCMLIKGKQHSAKGWRYVGPSNEERRFERHRSAAEPAEAALMR